MLTERLETLLVGNATGLVNSFREGETASEAFASKQTTTGKVMQTLGIQGMSTGQMIGRGLAVGSALGATALAGMAFQGVKHFADMTSAVRGFQRVTGASAEDSSRLAAATQRMGIDAGTAQSAFGQLTKRIGEHKDTLAQWGVEIVRNRDGSVNFARTLENISEKYSHLTDATQRQAFATENFGKGAQSINALLGQGKDNLQQFYAVAAEHHEIFSQSDLDKGLQYQRSIKDLETAFQGVELEIGGAVMPLITTFAHVLETGVEVLDAVGQAMGGVNLSAIALGAGIGALVGGPWGALAGGALGLVSALGLFGDTTDTTSQKVVAFTDALERANGKLDETAQKSARALLEERHQLDDLGRAGVQFKSVLDGTNSTTSRQVSLLRDMASATGDFVNRTQGSKEAIKETDGAYSGAAERLSFLRDVQGKYIDKIREGNPALAAQLEQLSRSNGLNSGLIITLAELAASHVKVNQQLHERNAVHATDAALTDKSAGATKNEANAAKEAANAFKTETDALNAVNDAQLAQIDKTFAAERATWAAKDAADALTGATWAAIAAGGQDAAANETQAKALVDAEDAALKAALAARDKAEADNQGSGSAYAHSAGVQAQIGSLQGLAGTLDPGSPLRVFLEQWIARLSDPSLNGTHTATVALSGVDEALARVQALKDALAAVPRELTVYAEVVPTGPNGPQQLL